MRKVDLIWKLDKGCAIKLFEIKADRVEKITVFFSVGKFQFGKLLLKYLKLVEFHEHYLTKK